MPRTRHRSAQTFDQYAAERAGVVIIGALGLILLVGIFLITTGLFNS